MEAKVLTRAEMEKVLEDAKCPPDLIIALGDDLRLWWKTGWAQEILLAQKRAGMKEVIEWTAREFGTDWSEEKEQLQKWGIE